MVALAPASPPPAPSAQESPEPGPPSSTVAAAPHFALLACVQPRSASSDLDRCAGGAALPPPPAAAAAAAGWPQWRPDPRPLLGVAPSEALLFSAACALKSRVLLQGRLYVFEHTLGAPPRLAT